MLGKLKPHISFANVISVIALFIALSAGAYAAFHLPNNSVKSKHIVNGQVKTGDLAANSVDGTKVGDGTLGGNDIDESTLGQVPSASNAANANNANNLGSLAPAAYGSALTARVNGIVNPLTPLTQYGPISGIGTATNTPGAPSTLSPNRVMVARDLAVVLTAGPGTGGGSVNVTMAVNGVTASGFSCFIQEFNVPNTTCTSTDTLSIPAHSIIELAFVTTPATNFNPGFDALVGLRLTPN